MGVVPFSVIVQAIVILIKNLPAVIAAIQQGIHAITVVIKEEEFSKDENAAEQSKDTSALENVFNPKSDSSGSKPS